MALSPLDPSKTETSWGLSTTPCAQCFQTIAKCDGYFPCGCYRAKQIECAPISSAELPLGESRAGSMLDRYVNFCQRHSIKSGYDPSQQQRPLPASLLQRVLGRMPTSTPASEQRADSPLPLPNINELREVRDTEGVRAGAGTPELANIKGGSGGSGVTSTTPSEDEAAAAAGLSSLGRNLVPTRSVVTAPVLMMGMPQCQTGPCGSRLVEMRWDAPTLMWKATMLINRRGGDIAAHHWYLPPRTARALGKQAKKHKTHPASPSLQNKKSPWVAPGSVNGDGAPRKKAKQGEAEARAAPTAASSLPTPILPAPSPGSFNQTLFGRAGFVEAARM